MRILIAPDSFKGTLTAQRVADIIGGALRAHDPATVITILPLADGGEGTLAAITASVACDLHRVRCVDPCGRTITAHWALTARGAAIIESAACIGMGLVEESRRHPRALSSAGLGYVLADILSLEDIAAPTDIVSPADVVSPADIAARKDAARTNAARTDAARTDAARTDAARTGRTHADFDSIGDAYAGSAPERLAGSAIERIDIALGGTATVDAGIGFAHALGWRFLDGHGREVDVTGRNAWPSTPSQEDASSALPPLDSRSASGASFDVVTALNAIERIIPPGAPSAPASHAAAGSQGLSTLPPGASALAPGASALPPGASALAPGASALTPDASALAPGASALPPGASALAPGASALAPGALALTRSLPIVRALVDVDVPLCGPHGAARMFGPQKGATPADVEALDAAFVRFAKIVNREFRKSGRPLVDPDAPGMGAAGGLGFALQAFCNAQIVSGAEEILDVTDFDRVCALADLVITGEGRYDAQSSHGKLVQVVARRAAALGVPTVLIAGRVDTAETAPFALVLEATPRHIPVQRMAQEAAAHLDASTRRHIIDIRACAR